MHLHTNARPADARTRACGSADAAQNNLLMKRDNATNVRETTTKAVAQALDENAIKKRLAAEAKRNDSRQWAREKAVNGYELVVRAKAGKKAVRSRRLITPEDWTKDDSCACAHITTRASYA